MKLNKRKPQEKNPGEYDTQLGDIQFVLEDTGFILQPCSITQGFVDRPGPGSFFHRRDLSSRVRQLQAQRCHLHMMG